MNAYYKGMPVFGPRGPAGPDGNPIGTVISFLGSDAPKDYLVCDGTQYSISLYPALASFFEAQFGTKNHFGGNGTATFAVPDMRNLFLRGYHGEAEEQLSGEIGNKQDATTLPMVYAGSPGLAISSPKNEFVMPQNTDSVSITTGGRRYSTGSNWVADAMNAEYMYTPRPVNMAVLYCIKAVESVAAENVYSTEETRIGTWIDGKPLYRKVFGGISPDTTDGAPVADTSDLSMDNIVNGYGWINTNSNNGIRYIPYTMDTSNSCFIYVSSDKSKLMMLTRGQSFGGKPFFYTVEYTKTTD